MQNRAWRYCNPDHLKQLFSGPGAARFRHRSADARFINETARGGTVADLMLYRSLEWKQHQIKDGFYRTPVQIEELDYDEMRGSLPDVAARKLAR
ncbi:hypothetical protein [Glutamicibacter sp. AOP5-A2-18]|uniref:hypothetical protein n=1 Tax=Glutamicibacter sp. AOP5-A2-18 TaxID=3457656 RepID=UPI004033EFE8